MFYFKLLAIHILIYLIVAFYKGFFDPSNGHDVYEFLGLFIGLIFIEFILALIVLIPWAIYITISEFFTNIKNWFRLKSLPPKVHNRVVFLKDQAKIEGLHDFFNFESALSEAERIVDEEAKVDIALEEAIRQSDINLREFKKEHKARIKKENNARKKSLTKRQSKTKNISSKKTHDEHEISEKIRNLNRNNVHSLWHITHRDNIKSICKKGILNHENANKLEYFDISNQGVQNRRQKIEPINNRSIHEYTPLFINPKNAMLYFLKDKRVELCLLEISLDVLECEYIYSDGNASRRDADFYGNDDYSFESLAWDNIFSESWTNFGERDEDKMSQMQSEFLIYPSIQSKYIKKIHCYSKESLKFLKNTHIDKPISLNRQAFTFEGEIDFDF